METAEVTSVAPARIECAVLVSWVGSLVVQMLRALAVAQERSQRTSPGR